MRSHFKHEIQFVKHRNLFFTISLVLVVLSIAGLLFRGLNFGIEFLGGSQVTFNDAAGVTQSQLRDAFADQGQPDAVVQTTSVNDVDGFMGTLIKLGSDEFKTWEEIIVYFERLGGQDR